MPDDVGADPSGRPLVLTFLGVAGVGLVVLLGILLLAASPSDLRVGRVGPAELELPTLALAAWPRAATLLGLGVGSSSLSFSVLFSLSLSSSAMSKRTVFG